MLVLTRKYQEKIKIGDNITITVLRMKGKAVRLGIEAPGNVPVIRGELSFIDGAAEESNGKNGTEPKARERATKTRNRDLDRAGVTDSKWATSSSPDAKGVANYEPASIGFVRVPRDQVASVVPKLVSGGAPLRSMMNGR